MACCMKRSALPTSPSCSMVYALMVATRGVSSICREAQLSTVGRKSSCKGLASKGHTEQDCQVE